MWRPSEVVRLWTIPASSPTGFCQGSFLLWVVHVQYEDGVVTPVFEWSVPAPSDGRFPLPYLYRSYVGLLRDPGVDLDDETIDVDGVSPQASDRCGVLYGQGDGLLP